MNARPFWTYSRCSDVRKIAKVEDLVSNNPHVFIENLTSKAGIFRERISYILHSELSLQKKEKNNLHDVMFQYDNALHKATIMIEYLHNKRVELSPICHTVQINISLFPWIKKQLKGKRCDKIENLAKAMLNPPLQKLTMRSLSKVGISRIVCKVSWMLMESLWSNEIFVVIIKFLI